MKLIMKLVTHAGNVDHYANIMLDVCHVYYAQNYMCWHNRHKAIANTHTEWYSKYPHHGVNILCLAMNLIVITNSIINNQIAIL